MDGQGSASFLVCGEALIDLVPLDAGPEPALRAAPGGSPYNVAIGLGRLGVETFFLGRLSRDPNGQRLARRLSGNGVRLDYVQYGSEPSTLAYVFPPEPGRPDVRYGFYLQGTCGAELQPADFPAPLAAEIGVVHFGSFAAVLPESGRLIREFVAASGRLVSYDPNVRPSITPDRDVVRPDVEACCGLADVVKLSDVDAAWLYPGRPLAEIAAAVLRLGPSIVAITRGAEGAEVFSTTSRVAVPGIPTEVVDTVGAGDTFMAAFLWDLGRRSLLLRAALRAADATALGGVAEMACRAAAIVCSRAGAEPPFASELL